MNLLHMKYAVEIAKYCSINKAAEALYVGQPTLSRAVKDLEGELGIKLFERSSKGMVPTPDGKIFVRYAQRVLQQVDEIDAFFSSGRRDKQWFSVSGPGIGYISDAFIRFSQHLDPRRGAELIYEETGFLGTMQHVLQDGYNLGIIRYPEENDSVYKAKLEEKSLSYELVARFRNVIVCSKTSSLAEKSRISANELRSLVEILHTSSTAARLMLPDEKEEEESEPRRLVRADDLETRLSLLAVNPEAYLWTCPLPAETMERYGLCTVRWDEGSPVFKDMLIHRADYRLNDLDNLFIEELIESKRRIFRS